MTRFRCPRPLEYGKRHPNENTCGDSFIKTSEGTKAPEAPLSHDLLYAARYYLGGRKALIALAGLIVVAGGALNWSWLVAVGVAPLLLSVLPCAAMCALGLCMNRMAGKSCSTGKVAADEIGRAHV